MHLIISSSRTTKLICFGKYGRKGALRYTDGDGREWSDGAVLAKHKKCSGLKLSFN